MSDPTAEQLLFLPPVPQPAGLLVEVVVLTEDGGQLRIPLVHRHGAWWAP